MAVLAVTHRDDMHAHALIWALGRRNVRCNLWSVQEFPEFQRASTRISNWNATQVDVSCLGATTSYETVWARRVNSPKAISERLAPEDRAMALLEAQRCIDGMLAVIALDAIWINSFTSARLANAKAYQLHLARAMGFVIPETVISNDPAVIRAFVGEHDGNVIYKAFAPAYWSNVEQGSVAGLFTALVRPEVFDEEVAITSCPGIYQVKISKSADIRLVFFGDTFYGGRILSQVAETTKLDFRADLKQEACIEPYGIPAELLDQCNAFRKELGLLHGSFDFVEQPDGTLVFLELNTMGQFLFLEERAPSLPLLDAFASFSLDPTDSFRHKPGRNAVSFSDFASSQEYHRAREMMLTRMRTDRLNAFTYSE